MNFIDEHKNVVPIDLCNEIIERFENDESNKIIGRTANVYGEYNEASDFKVCTELDISAHESWKDIDNKVFQIVQEIHNKLTITYEGYKNIAISSDEGYRIKKYEKGVGIYKPHLDCAAIESAARYLTIIVYLNTVKEGGETYFPELNINIKPEAGKVCTFPAAWTHIHGSKIPLSNDKYIIATWMALQ